MFGKKTTEETTPEETTPEEKTTEKTQTAIIDHSGGGGNIKQSIETAKEIVSQFKDIAVKIKTPKGEPNVNVFKKKKKKYTKEEKRSVDLKTLKRIASRDCSIIKNTRRKAKCQTEVAKAKKDIQLFMLRMQAFRR
jgi:microcompartment protein CcmL/EutN